YTANSGASRKFIVDRIRTTAGQSGVSGGDIYAIPIPLCTTEEQHQIVQEIESRLSVAEHLEQTVEESLRQAEVLRQSILQRAFSGQLVPQDPNDESASELLKRIQREKSDGLTKKVPASSSLPTPNQQLPIAFS
ncbi:MAG: type I restriction endonuclease subunit S, partial [Bacteroidota bacterium]